MTKTERALLIILAKHRVGELKGVIAMIDQELANPQMPEQQKAFLVMQRGQAEAVSQEIGQAAAAVIKESSPIIGL